MAQIKRDNLQTNYGKFKTCFLKTNDVQLRSGDWEALLCSETISHIRIFFNFLQRIGYINDIEFATLLIKMKK